MENNIIPVLLGADLNCYSVARAFNEEYGVKSYVFGKMNLGTIKYSKIINFTQIPSNYSRDELIAILTNFASNLSIKPILLGCSDEYAEFIIDNKEALSKFFIIPYIDFTIKDDLINKASFYELCDKYELDYPDTIVVSSIDDDYKSKLESFDSTKYVVKPSSSIKYWKHPFENMKKAYILSSKAEIIETINTIFKSGYDDKVIIQKFVPGDDSHMYVLTCYSDKNGQVKMMGLGNVLLEEHSPKAIGNHAAILSCVNDDLQNKIQTFLEKIHYVGFSNFDIKYDSEDGKYKLFEINLRQGRSNFYLSGGGINISKLIVDDYINNENINYASLPDGKYWHTIPNKIVLKYVSDSKKTNIVKAIIKNRNDYTSLDYKLDFKLNPLRFIYCKIHYLGYFKKYRKYFN